MLIRSLLPTHSLFLVIVLLCLKITAGAMPAGEKDSVITMPFGQNNMIIYSLTNGTYDVVFNGKKTITGAYALCKGKTEMTSAGDAVRHYTFSTRTIHDRVSRYEITTERNGLRMQQVFNLYGSKNYFLTTMRIIGKGVAANFMSPMITENIVFDDKGDNRALFVPFDNDMWARFNALPLQQANFTGSEVTAIYNNDTYKGLVIGAVEQNVWKTGVAVKANGNNPVSVSAFGGFADSSITHDKIPHGLVTTTDSTCASPEIFVGAFADWRTGMEDFAGQNKGDRDGDVFYWKKGTPVGWNSWGAIQSNITLDKAKRVIDFFADSCKGYRNSRGDLYIDLDSFWDNLVKGGLDGNVEELKQFVQYCKSKKFKPGIYWAPFTDWGKHDRKMEGSNYTYAQAWLMQNGKPVALDGAYALDATHPGTKARIDYYLTHFKELGFKMIKIDFLGHGALECDRFYDSTITTGMQAYKVGMKCVTKAIGKKMLVYAAISPTMATAPYVHMRRIACDAFSAIDNTEYTLNSTGYGWWQSRLYQFADADHVVFNKESEGANRARLASALVTGTLITGDDYGTHGPWSNVAKHLLQNKDLLKIIKDGRSFKPVEANTGNKGIELFVKTGFDRTSFAYLAAFNYSNTPRTYTLSLSRLSAQLGSLVTADELLTKTNEKWQDTIQITIPPSDARIFLLRPILMPIK